MIKTTPTKKEFNKMYFQPLQPTSGFTMPVADRKQRRKVPVEELIDRLRYHGENAGIDVTEEHAGIMKAVFHDHRNVLITGGAGVGKTTFVKHILIPELEHLGLKFDVTASTGIAGTLLNARTLHSWAGCGLGPQWPPGVSVMSLSPRRIRDVYEETYLKWNGGEKGESQSPRMRAQRSGVKNRIKSCSVLLVDEVSMMAGVGFLGYLDYYFRRIREIDEPFGGIQIIFIGDFCQLPPVERYAGKRPDWAFLCPAWQEADVLPCPLTRVYRQKARWFVDILNKVREGYPLGEDDKKNLAPLVRKVTEEDRMRLTFLMPTNKEADYINAQVLQRYQGEQWDLDMEFVIHAHHKTAPWETDDKIKKQLTDGKIMRERLSIKPGLPVMITINDSVDSITGTQRFVNGTKAFVHSVQTTKNKDGVPFVSSVIVRIPPPKGKESVPQYNEDGTPKLNEKGEHIYVKLQDTIVHLNRVRWCRNAHDDPEETVIVGDQALPAFPYATQFPLIPASAITIHKSQGQSLDECVISAEKAFAPGHVYVALSRLTSPEGLTLTSLDLPIYADPDAMAFVRGMRPVTVDLGAPPPPL